jgi:Yersinia/Haemophilus virulence surface antigen
MNIAEVMHSTAAEYHAAFTLFDQSGLSLSAVNKSGVCFGLCKAWLRSLDKVASHKFWAFCTSEPNRLQIERKQDRHSRLRPDGTRRGEKHLVGNAGNVKSLHIYKALQKTQEEFWTDSVEQMSRLYRSDLMVINGRSFWMEVSERIPYTTRKNLISLRIQNGQDAHAVASCAQGGQSYFFDPNGGIMAFKDTVNLKKWLKEKFPTAEEYEHPKIQCVTVYDYRHGEKDPWTYDATSMVV